MAERGLEREDKGGIEKHVCAGCSDEEGEEEGEEGRKERKAGEEVKGDITEREEN